MANPFQSRKKTVDMAAPVVRVSRIRRDPPPPVKKVSVRDIKEREAHTIVIGITAFALALFIIALGFSSAMGWTPRHYIVHM